LRRDIAEKLVADLGSGPGMLSIGAALMGAAHVVGFELDQDAIDTATSTCDEMEIDTIDFVHADVTRLCDQVCKAHHRKRPPSR
jgi:putative methylase